MQFRATDRRLGADARSRWQTTTHLRVPTSLYSMVCQTRKRESVLTMISSIASTVQRPPPSFCYYHKRHTHYACFVWHASPLLPVFLPFLSFSFFASSLVGVGAAFGFLARSPPLSSSSTSWQDEEGENCQGGGEGEGKGDWSGATRGRGWGKAEGDDGERQKNEQLSFFSSFLRLQCFCPMGGSGDIERNVRIWDW